MKDHCHYAGKYRGVAHDICNLRYKTLKEIPVVFHNGSTYNHHFIIKNLAEEFDGGVKKEIAKKDNSANDKIIKISYKIRFINSYRFMLTSLSKLIDNLSEGFHNDKSKDCESYLDYLTIKDNQLIFRCFSCKKYYEKDFRNKLIQKFVNIYDFCNRDHNKFILLLRKVVYPYEYMDNWERFNEILLPNKEAFYSNLSMEDITDTDYRHANLGENHDLYVQSDTLVLADVFEDFRKMCIKVYELDPAHSLSAPRLAWQACLKKTGVELELLTDNGM